MFQLKMSIFPKWRNLVTNKSKVSFNLAFENATKQTETFSKLRRGEKTSRFHTFEILSTEYFFFIVC